MTQKKVSIFMGGTGANSAAEARDALGVLATSGGTITGNLNVSSTLITQNVEPLSNITYDLGTSTKRFKDLWLSNSTIHLGEATISAQGGNVSFGNAEVQLSNVTAKLNVTNDLFVSGNVGIGTEIPAGKLQVSDSSAPQIRSHFSGSASSGNKGSLIFSHNRNSDGTQELLGYIQGIAEDNQSAGGIRFVARNNTDVETFRITSAGNVGIGTTSPSYSLDVTSSAQWSARINSTANNNGGLLINRVTGYNPNIGFSINNSIKWYMNTNASDDSFNLFNSAGASPQFTLLQNGNVGIGTTNPSTKLHLYESGAADVLFRITPANGTYDPLIQFTGQGNDITAEGFEIWYDNDVGDVHLLTTYANDAAAIRFHTRTGASKSTSNERLTINGNGNVGIGTTSPSAKLHVEDGSLLVGDISGGSTSTPSNYRIQLDNSYAAGTTSASYFPKIVMHEASTWLGGFGISDSHVDYFSGMHHRWFTGTNPSTPTRGIERLKIWDSGYVTMPTQTMISARHTTTETPSGGTPLLQWTIDVNQGGGSWNAGTGAYTVPVAGRYFVTCSLLRNTGGAAGGIILHKNGVPVNRLFYCDNVGSSGYVPGSGQIIVDCGAGDSLRFMNESTVTWYGDGAGLGSFTINLLG